jgi:hypothetical protein
MQRKVKKDGLQRTLTVTQVQQIADLACIKDKPPHEQPSLIARKYFEEYGCGNNSRNGIMLETAMFIALTRAGAEPITQHIQLKPPNKSMGRQKGWEIDLFCEKTCVIIGCKISGRERIQTEFGLSFYIFGTGAWAYIWPNRSKPRMYVVTRQEHQADPENVENTKEWLEHTGYWLTLGEKTVTLVTILDLPAMKELFDVATGAINAP